MHWKLDPAVAMEKGCQAIDELPVRKTRERIA
jgi:hypothetical protein